MKKLITVILALACVGCHIPAKMVVEGNGGRSSYNIEVQRTNAQEMLLNLVRLRYYDSPMFLQISSVTTQYTYKNSSSLSVPIPGLDSDNPGKIGLGTEWQNQPTVQYTPLEGKEFANQLMNPLDIAIIQQVIYSGWDIAKVFMLAIQSLNEFHNIPREGTIKETFQKYKNFYDVIHLMRELQKEGMLQVGIRNVKKNDIIVNNIQFAFPVEDEYSQKIAKLLSLPAPTNGKYILSIVEGFDEKGNIGILPRSLLSCMYYLSENIIIPQYDLQQKKARIIRKHKLKDSNKKMFEDLLTIHSCKTKPNEYYIAIKYRDSWFYIKDSDLNSKKTFMLLLELYNLQSGSKAQDRGPILTLPIGVS